MKDDLGWLLVIIIGGLILVALWPLALIRHLTKEEPQRHKPTEREWLAIIRE